MSEVLYIVVPCYNEEEVLPETAKKLGDKLDSLIERGMVSPASRILFVNDGSGDETWSIIKELHRRNPHFSGICLTRNRGHQNALMAGMMECRKRADLMISMDADLQDDIDAVDRMVEEYQKGHDIVYGVRSSRKTDTFFKRFTAEGFYKFMKMMGVDIVFNHADFRLMSSRVLDALSQYGEVNLFIRGIIPEIGFKSENVYYKRYERFAGESKYPLKKMISFAVDGITSFSVKPLRIITNIGMILFVISILAFLWVFIGGLTRQTETGWPSMMCSLWALGGLQIFFLGIIGEYVGKIYFEAKKRPRFIIKDILLDQKDLCAKEG